MSDNWRQFRRGMQASADDPRVVERGERGGDRLVASIAAAGQFGVRHRYQLAPLAVGLLLLAAGAAAYYLWGPLLTLPGVVLTGGGLIALTRWWLRRRVDRAYALDCVVLAGLWVELASWWGPAAGPLSAMLLVLAVMVAVLGVPWWFNHRIRRAIQVEREIEKWPGLLEQVGLAGARLAGVVPLDYGWMGRIRFAHGKTFSNLVAAVATIESLRGLREGAVQVEPDRDHRDAAYIRVIDRDPHAEPIPWPGPSAEYAADAFPVGLYDDGGKQELRIFTEEGTRHVLIGGETGSGKSGMVHRIAVELVPLPDVVLLLVDLKGGQELGAYRPAAHAVATTTADAERMLAGVDRLIDVRGETAGEKTWTVTPERPGVLIVVDESARLSQRSRDMLDGVTQRGRSVGVAAMLSTQYPTNDAVNSQTKAQCTVRACFAMMSTNHQRAVLAKLNKSDGVDAAQIPGDRPGTCYLETPGDRPRPSLLRVHHVDEDTVGDVVRASSPTPLDGLSADALASVLEDTDSGQRQADSGQERAPGRRGGQRRADNAGATDTGTDVDELSPIPSGIPVSALAVEDSSRRTKPRLSRTEAERVFDETLAAAGDAGTSPKALCDATGYSRRWVNNRLDEVDAERVDHGIYRVRRHEEATV